VFAGVTVTRRAGCPNPVRHPMITRARAGTHVHLLAADV
jgi:hypothetical protein